jgi:hypothetical protein
MLGGGGPHILISAVGPLGTGPCGLKHRTFYPFSLSLSVHPAPQAHRGDNKTILHPYNGLFYYSQGQKKGLVYYAALAYYTLQNFEEENTEVHVAYRHASK